MSTRCGRKRKQTLKPREEEHNLEAAFESVELLEVKLEPNEFVSTAAQQCVDEGQLAATFNDDHEIDEKPDIHELQQEILRQQELVSKILCQEQTKDKRSADRNSHLSANLMLSVSSAAASSGATITTQKVETTKEFKIIKPENELDRQESDCEEDGYSEIDFGVDQIFEEDDDVDVYDPKWHSQPLTPRLVFNFTVDNTEIGLKRRPKDNNPIYYFNRILRSKSDFFKEFTSGSNIMLGHYFGEVTNFPFTEKEMQTFMGLCLQMCNIKFLTLSEYWNEEANYGFTGFAHKMSFDRFCKILRSLSFNHLSVRKTINQNDPLRDVNPLLDFFNESMAVVYTCGQRIVLNEPMTYWKGKFKWHSDMKEKFRMNALNLHFLTEPSGLVVRVLPEIQDDKMKGITRDSRLLVTKRNNLAVQLLKDNINNGRTVYASKYYGSYGLAYVLTNVSTYCTGFLDAKRYGNSKELVMTPLEKNSYETKYAAPLMMAKWRQFGKSFYFFSSDCLAISPMEMFVVKVDCRPKIVKDIAWQLKLSETNREYLTNYQLGLQTGEMTCNQHLVVFIFNLIVLNAYILYSMSPQFKRTRPVNYKNELKSYAEFRQDIIRSLLRDELEKIEIESILLQSQQRRKMPKLDNEESFNITEVISSMDKNVHVPTMIPSRHGKQLKKKCRVCFSKAGLQTLTKYVCDLCPGMPGLCNVPCFAIWHGKMLNTQEEKLKVKTRKHSPRLPKNDISISP